MHAGFVGSEVRDHGELRVIHVLPSVDFEMHDPPNTRDARAIEPQPDLGLFGLAIGVEAKPTLATPHAAVDGRRNDVGRDLRERRDVVRTLVEMRLHDGAVDD